MYRKLALTWLRHFNRVRVVSGYIPFRVDLVQAGLKREQKAWDLLVEARNTAPIVKEQPRHV